MKGLVEGLTTEDAEAGKSLVEGGSVFLGFLVLEFRIFSPEVVDGFWDGFGGDGGVGDAVS